MLVGVGKFSGKYFLTKVGKMREPVRNFIRLQTIVDDSGMFPYFFPSAHLHLHLPLTL